MKKFFIAVAFLMAGIVNAQQFELGVKAGVNFASLDGDKMEWLESRTGIHFGLIAELPVSGIFSVQPEIFYSALGATGSEADETYKLDYISVPFMAKLYVVEGLSLEAGPQFAINVLSEAERNGETEKIRDVETLEFAAGFGAGYQLPMGLFFQGRYVLGINEAWEFPGLKNNVFQLSAGYKF
jgi:hypothetical protein